MPNIAYPTARSFTPLALVLAGLVSGCGSSDSPGTTGEASASTTTTTTTTTSASSATSSSSGSGASGGGGSTSTTGAGGCGEDPSMPDEVLDATSDPFADHFTIDDALVGLPPGPGPLRAVITTEKGDLTCELADDVAPFAVANFVGLARGTRPWFDFTLGVQAWTLRRFYDGLTWHRVIPGFVAQGGDPAGNGTGGPGYNLADEFTDLKHVPGAIAYAKAADDKNGSQFYVTETAQPSLDGSCLDDGSACLVDGDCNAGVSCNRYTVFGVCTPVSVVTALTGVPRDSNDKPLTPIHMTSIRVTRCAP